MVVDLYIHFGSSLATNLMRFVQLLLYNLPNIMLVNDPFYVLMQRNYRFFYMFVFSTTLLCIYVFGFCWVYVIRIKKAEQTSIWRAMIKTPASIVLIIYTFLSVWFVGGLSIFHLYLMSTNQVIVLPSENSLLGRDYLCQDNLFLIL